MDAASHFEFTGEQKVNSLGVTLGRIRATRDLQGGSVKAGTLGGWLEPGLLADGTARLRDAAWVADEAELFGQAHAREFANIWNHAQVYGDAHVFGTAFVSCDARVFDDAVIRGEAEVNGNAVISGYACVENGEVQLDAAVGGAAMVTGRAVVGDRAVIDGEARVADRASVTGSSRVGGTARITGSARIRGDAVITQPNHVLIVDPVGVHAETLVFYRRANGLPGISLGPRSLSTLSDLEAVVGQAEGAALLALCQAAASRWAEDFPVPDRFDIDDDPMG
ncbi:MAG: hypothetical protein JWR01_516 [Subtercola sp.]|nr:hypothetical protein [Subtercola sp.]